MRWLLVVVIAIAGCTNHDPVEPQVTAGVIQKRFPIGVNRRIDVLFVIDSSPAMRPHADTVRANLGRFVDILRAQPAGFPNLRLGVVTADVATDDGVLRGTQDLLGHFVVDFVGPDGNRVRNYDGDLAGVFARLAAVGTDGATATPLAAIERALENPANRTFVRDEAFTAVFVISATDDDPLVGERVATFLKGLHADPSKVIVGGALGDGAGIPAFLDRFPNRSVRASITDADWASTLFAIIAQSYRTSLGAPCIEGPLLDLEVPTPGLQPACAVWYEFPIGGEVVPACADAPGTPCWKIVEDRPECPLPPGGLLVLEQPRTELPEAVMLNVDCISRHDD